MHASFFYSLPFITNYPNKLKSTHQRSYIEGIKVKLHCLENLHYLILQNKHTGNQREGGGALLENT